VPVEDYLVQAGVDIEALKSKFFDFTVEEASYNGKLYALPFDTDARVLYYNKKLFKEAGLDPNKPPRTISELDDGSSDCIDCTYNNFLLLCAKLFNKRC